MNNHLPIILLVSERSGSNLLRTMLGNHKEISAPVAPHLLATFYNIRKYYGDLRNSNNSSELISDMLGLANHPYHNWKLSLNFESQQSFPNSIISSFDFLYTQKSLQEGKTHYCSKGIHSFEFIDQLRAELPNVKFVHLVRDPRDHVASWMKKPINWKLEFGKGYNKAIDEILALINKP
ncbi:MAG: sulfotransferase [Bacteroidetes bacterium]|nr:sulfotransferase [Bacteroidota bacterium]